MGGGALLGHAEGGNVEVHVGGSVVHIGQLFFPDALAIGVHK